MNYIALKLVETRSYALAGLTILMNYIALKPFLDIFLQVYCLTILMNYIALKPPSIYKYHLTV